MLREVCRVKTSDSANVLPDPASVVFVAGVGVISASAYNELQAAGPAMCQTVANACKADWTSSRCVASRALFGGSAP
jgi:hypothetical protein